ncbi:hypothetical protein P8631_13540, partial [Guyparkeria sp. 1SP6A2]|nr:hypothetical protein [Guyparkeria sp. 1SP6A2]
MNDRCVYFHSTPDTKEVFYIGMGSLKRAHDLKRRNKYWLETVLKHGKPIVLVIAKNLSTEDASRIEKF